MNMQMLIAILAINVISILHSFFLKQTLQSFVVNIIEWMATQVIRLHLLMMTRTSACPFT